MTNSNLPQTQSSFAPAPADRRLTAAEFQGLAEMPPESEWFANKIRNPNTRRNYMSDVREFARFLGIGHPEEFRDVTPAHVIAWREHLSGRPVDEIKSKRAHHDDEGRQVLSPGTIRRKLAAVSSLMSYLCEKNAILHNPARGVERPNEGNNQGVTEALSDEEMRAMLDAPAIDTLKGQRDRAILSTFARHGLRRFEVGRLRVRDIIIVKGSKHFYVRGKGRGGAKPRKVLIHAETLERLDTYLQSAGHGDEPNAPLFPSLSRRKGFHQQLRPLTPDALHKDIIVKYAKSAGVHFVGFWTHCFRVSGGTKALDNKADLMHVQEWLGHSSIETTRRFYDKRRVKVEESPTLKVDY